MEERVFVISQLEGKYIDVKGVFKNLEDVHRWINNDRVSYFENLVYEPDYRVVTSIEEVFLVDNGFKEMKYYDLKTEVRNLLLNCFYDKGIDIEPFWTVSQYIAENPQENWWKPTQEEFDEYILNRPKYTQERDMQIKLDKDKAQYEEYLRLKEIYEPTNNNKVETI